jgi:hypothetical protein
LAYKSNSLRSVRFSDLWPGGGWVWSTSLLSIQRRQT